MAIIFLVFYYSCSLIITYNLRLRLNVIYFSFSFIRYRARTWYSIFGVFFLISLGRSAVFVYIFVR